MESSSSHSIFPSFQEQVLSKTMARALHFLLFLSSLLVAPIDHQALAAEDCSVFACPDNDISIRFPFQVQGQSCGYPGGFNLTCSSQGTASLDLPNSGKFLVRDINYLTQQIQLYDPDNCLPRRFLRSFNLSGSPFVADFHQNFTFITCPTQVSKSRFASIDCLSNDTISVLATSSMSLARSMPESCETIATLAVPVSWPVEYEEGFSSELNDDLVLSWYNPDCRDCEAQGGTCGFLNDQETHCFLNPSTGQSKGSRIFRIIALSIAVPAILGTFGIACFACFVDRRERRLVEVNNMAMNTDPPEPISETIGLDESTIESYTKLVLGESRRIPGLNDTTCPICLSDYCTKETLRCIPDCKHCFHADCIDEWLRLNATCPVCRNSPKPSPSHDT